VTAGVRKNRLLTWLAERRRSIAYISVNAPIELPRTSQASAPASGSGSGTRGCSITSVATPGTRTPGAPGSRAGNRDRARHGAVTASRPGLPGVRPE